jgi:hypothetical protein
MTRKNQSVILVCLVYVIGPTKQIIQTNVPVCRLCCVEVPAR